MSTTSFERDRQTIPQSDDNILDANFHQNTIQVADSKRDNLIIEDINYDRDNLITLGELLDGVKWQVTTADLKSKVPDPNRIDRVHDVSRNYK